MAAIQQWIHDWEAEISAVIATGRTYYAHNKIHSTDCPTIRQQLEPSTSWYWVDGTADPQVIKARYADITGTGGGSGWYLWMSSWSAGCGGRCRQESP